LDVDGSQQLFLRAHLNLPEHFPTPNPEDYEIVEDLMGIRPLRPAGVMVERVVIGGQDVVHAYGTTVGGYMHSFGLARHAVRLIEQSLAEEPNHD